MIRPNSTFCLWKVPDDPALGQMIRTWARGPRVAVLRRGNHGKKGGEWAGKVEELTKNLFLGVDLGGEGPEKWIDAKGWSLSDSNGGRPGEGQFPLIRPGMISAGVWGRWRDAYRDD